MDIHPEQKTLVMKTYGKWVEQASDALDAIVAANDGQDLARISDAAEIAPEPFGRLVEAFVALEAVGGPHVSDELIRLAGLRPVDVVVLWA